MVIFIVPLITTFSRNDDIVQEQIETTVEQFTVDVRNTGIITMEKIEKLQETLNATGNVYTIELEVQKRDENPSKKAEQAVTNKIGEDYMVTYYTTNIMEEIETSDSFKLNEGDMISVKVYNENPTLYQTLSAKVFKSSSEDINKTTASSAGMVNVSADKSLSNNTGLSGDDTLQVSLSFEYSEGSTQHDNWTNKDVKLIGSANSGNVISKYSNITNNIDNIEWKDNSEKGVSTSETFEYTGTYYFYVMTANGAYGSAERKVYIDKNGPTISFDTTQFNTNKTITIRVLDNESGIPEEKSTIEYWLSPSGDKTSEIAKNKVTVNNIREEFKITITEELSGTYDLFVRRSRWRNKR